MTQKFIHKYIIFGWAIGVVFVVIFEGFGWCGFDLPDDVLHTLIGGLSVKVLGTFVADHHYKSKNGSSSQHSAT